MGFGARREEKDRMFYIIDDIRLLQKTAAAKARTDISYFLNPDLEVCLFQHEQKGLAQLEIIRSEQKMIRESRTEDTVLIHWPLYLRRPCDGTGWISRVKGKKIAVIHDLNSLRDQAGNAKIRQEISGLNQFQTVIAHNGAMKQWLLEHGLSVPVAVLGLFDYKGDTDKIPERIFQKKERYAVAVAGNLSQQKAGYLYQMKASDVYFVNAYGVNYTENVAGSGFLLYQGSFAAEELPGRLEADFGLVWDGPSAKTCVGAAGNYLRYNNPHKLSLYIRSGLPVILWKEAALAPFVEEHKLGFTIESLDEIAPRLKNINSAQYAAYQEQVKRYAKQLENGEFIKRAMKEAIGQA